MDQVPPQGMTCRPDWIRLVGPDYYTSWLIEHLTALFGEAIEWNGAKFFQRGLQWHPGVLFSSGHKSEQVMIDLQGSRLACTPVDEFMKLTTEILKKGFHCKRIDLAMAETPRRQRNAMYDQRIDGRIRRACILIRRNQPSRLRQPAVVDR